MSRRQFDRQHVVDTALAILDDGGPDALSVRAVATALDVRPNAIYTYVEDRAALDGAVAERVLAMADLSLLTGPPSQWRRRVERFALSVREVLLLHPGVVSLLMSAPLNGPVALSIGEGLLDAFADAGLSPRDGARASYAVMVHTLGSLALDVAETDGRAPLDPEEDRVAARAAAFAQAAASAMPRTAAAAPIMATWVGETQFRWGLARLLDGIVRP
jgi:TetR/AcrR family transcriptional regulator, tetracycline repressor protein